MMLMMSGRHRRGRGGINPLFAMIFGSLFVLMLGLGKASSAMGPPAVLVWLGAIAGAVVVLRGPLGEALLRSLAESDRDPEAVAAADPAVLRELDDLRAQVSELQERVDFAERLLARERDMRPLGTGDAP